MTIIPDDTDLPGRADRTDGARAPDVAERIEHAGERTEDATRRIAAAISGALEGFIAALERYDVANEGRRAMENAGDVTRSAAVEARTQGQTPEMQQLKRGIQNVGTMAGDVGAAAGERVHAAGDAVRETAHDARETMHEAMESAKYAAVRVKEGVKVRAEAVAESGRRARTAPGHIAHELSEAFASWKRALVTTIAMMIGLAIFASVALVVLTIALVVGLNALLGDPAGTFVVALLYVVVAGIAYAVSRSVRMKAALEREERMENVREEVRHVVRPVRDAFGRRGTY